MKKLIFTLALGSIVLLNGADFKLTVWKPWQKIANGEYSAVIESHREIPLWSKLAVEKGKTYKLTWEDRVEGEKTQKITARLNLDGKISAKYSVISKEWTKHTVYIHNHDSANFEFYLRPSKAGAGNKVFMRNIECRTMSDAEMKENLIENGNFEDNRNAADSWLVRGGKDSLLKVVGGQGFMNGAKSLEFSMPKRDKKKFGFTSQYIPFVPGETYVLTFWAKASTKVKLSSEIMLWSPFFKPGHTGKHFWKGHNFIVTNEWHEFRREVTFPSDIAEYPDLKWRASVISFIIPSNTDEGTIWVDDISFQKK